MGDQADGQVVQRIRGLKRHVDHRATGLHRQGGFQADGRGAGVPGLVVDVEGGVDRAVGADGGGAFGHLRDQHRLGAVPYQQTFKRLPGFWKNFGFVGNYSYVDAETTVVRSGQTVTVPLEGMSNNSWNGTVYYELPKWGARVSVNNRDDYISDNTGSNGNISHATTGPVRWDMSAFWHFNDAYSLTLEGINLTDEVERLYTTGDGTMNLIREINYSGRQVFLGVRWNI